MAIEIDLSKLRSSWTKYDIVRVMEVIESLEILEKFINKEAKIDEPILRAFLGVNSLNEPLPTYWIEIQNHPKEKKLFALLATIFTHEEIIAEFANYYSTGDMKGTFIVDSRKQSTNIRSALIESGAAQPIYRKKTEVPFDFSPIFHNIEVGKLFKQLLFDRISKLTKAELADSDFYTTCYVNNFHKALGLSEKIFKSWLEGTLDIGGNFTSITKVQISNFFSIKEEINLDLAANEIYFLGENGDGKSLILMAIYLAFNGNFILEKTDQEKTGKVADIIKTNKDIILKGLDSDAKEYNPQKGIYLKNMYGYGTHRGRFDTDNPEKYGFMSLFNNDETLVNPETWLKDQKLLELAQKIDSIIDVEKDQELPYSLSVASLEKMFYELLEKNVEIKIEKTEVFFIEKGAKLRFNELSEGYRSIIIFISDLISRLSKNMIKGEKITDLKGVVLVDEIDLHLHPKWQRGLVKNMRNLFPNIQFIFTTHSPTMIQGASEDAIIYRVFRNSVDGITRVSDPYLRKDLDHLMINTLITSPLFGLDDSRMDSDNNEADTSDTYLQYRINIKLENELKKLKSKGVQLIKDTEIDQLIQTIINEEIGTND